jgi:phosphate acyltransferase
VVIVAVDAMGGDDAPATIVAGAVLAAGRPGIGIVLVGPIDRIREELSSHPDAGKLRITILDAADVVAMEEPPLSALRRKPRASVKVAAEAVKEGLAHALFSAGHTGATLLAAHTVFGPLPGAERPALAVTIPTRTGRAVLLDAGANADCRADHLVQFGLMGAAYARIDLRLEHPRVGLLSIGEEAGKGNELIREAHAGLSRLSLGFIGNLEARELFDGRADVIVCDGFTGNIALKVGEGLVDAVEHMLREEFGGPAGDAALLSTGAFGRFRKRVDYAEYGGAPLLGVGAVTVVAHGRSSARAVENGIAMAARLVEERVVERLGEALCT